MCRKCTRHHHTLLHRDADNSSQRKPDNEEAKEEAHVAALSVTEQVLLMTCKVKVTAPNGSSTIARALIDIDKYFVNNQAEPVPQADIERQASEVFYLPIHVVRKESSTTTKIRAVFDASAKTSTGASLNDILLVGRTVHPPLVDVLIRFRSHRVALIADVSRIMHVQSHSSVRC